ncbi:hypothetical protein JZ751_009681, partial [Albula glossodonta]
KNAFGFDLDIELEPLLDDVLHAKPNANAVASIAKTIHALSREKDETEAVRAMSLLSVDVNLSSKAEQPRAAPEPMDEEPAL